jgi:hypothetical protein
MFARPCLASSLRLNVDCTLRVSGDREHEGMFSRQRTSLLGGDMSEVGGCDGFLEEAGPRRDSDD